MQLILVHINANELYLVKRNELLMPCGHWFCTLISAFSVAYTYVCSLNFSYNILLVPSLINELNKIFDT